MQGAMLHSNWAKQNLDATRQTVGSDSVSGGALDVLSSTGDALAFLAGAADLTPFANLLNGLSSAYSAAVAEVAGMNGVNPARLGYSKALLNTVFTTPKPVVASA
jgi:hypothetical protein